MKLFKEILLAAAILSFAAAVPASARTLDKECHPIPANYKTTDATRQGRLEAVSYTVKSYMTGKDIAKIAWVYLPYGYDNSEKDYNVFYIVHGGAETIDTYFGFNRDGKSDFKRIFDHTFENGEAEPCIIVNASWICDDYTGTLDAATKATEEFHNELVNNLIPTIVSIRLRTTCIIDFKLEATCSSWPKLGQVDSSWSVLPTCLVGVHGGLHGCSRSRVSGAGHPPSIHVD